MCSLAFDAREFLLDAARLAFVRFEHTAAAPPRDERDAEVERHPVEQPHALAAVRLVFCRVLKRTMVATGSGRHRGVHTGFLTARWTHRKPRGRAFSGSPVSRLWRQIRTAEPVKRSYRPVVGGDCDRADTWMPVAWSRRRECQHRCDWRREAATWSGREDADDAVGTGHLRCCCSNHVRPPFNWRVRYRRGGWRAGTTRNSPRAVTE